MKQFLPFLTDDQGRSLAIEDAVVVSRPLPDPLEHSPEGWESNTLQWARNNEFRGVIKSYTTPLKFYLDGAKILRNAFYRMGMEVVIFFIWLKQNTAFGAGMKYEGWYKGEVDFGTFKDEYDGVEVNITEGGFYKDLQANKTVVYNIPFDNDAKYIYMDGMNLYQKINYSDIADLDISLNFYGEEFLGPYTLLGQDGSSVGFLVSSENLETAPSGFTNVLLSTNNIIKNLTKGTVDVTISGTLEFKCTSMTSSPAWAIKFRYLRSNQLLVNQNDYQIISTAAMVVGQTYTQDFSITIPLQPNESLFREGIFFGGVGSDAIIQFTANSVSAINFITRQPSNVIPAFRAFDYGNKLTALLSQEHTLSSPLLEPDQNLMITCGDAIRNLPGAVIKWTFSDYNKSIDAVKCIAIDIANDNPVLSSRYDKFNKNSSIAQLGECSNWTLEPAPDYIYDTVESGYPAKSSQSDNDVNGKYSFNNTYLWKINTTRRNINQYECKATCFADPYDIELIRVNFDQKDTTTANTDNSVFFIDAELKQDIFFTGTTHFYNTDNRIEINGDISEIQQFLIPGVKFNIFGSLHNNGVYTITEIIDITDGVDAIFGVLELVASNEDAVTTLVPVNLYKLRRVPYASITGIPNDGTIFNIELSPRRCLQNHLRWLRSSFDHLDMNKLVFQSTDKNASLVTVDNSGNVISESADIPVSSMGEKVYLPYIVKFDVRSPYNLLELMTANDDGKFDYLRNGLPFDGFPIQIATNDANLESQEYQLLCTSNNDLATLINNR